MSRDTLGTVAQPAWKIFAAMVFVTTWAIVGSVLMPVEGQRPFEEVSAFAGRVIGQGMVVGLVAALVAHFGALRKTRFRVISMLYAVALVVGAVTSWLLHGSTV